MTKCCRTDPLNLHSFLVYICGINYLYLNFMQGSGYTLKGLPGHEIGITAGVLRKVFAARIKQPASGMSPEQLAVLVCLFSGKGFHQYEIAAYVEKDDATITRILDTLEKKGFAVRKKSEGDRRANKACITPDGLALVGRVFPMIRELNDTLVEGFSQAEIARLAELLGRVRQNALRL